MAVRIRKEVLKRAIQDSQVIDRMATGILYAFPAIYKYPDNMELYMSIMSPLEAEASRYFIKLFGCEIAFHEGTLIPYITMKAHQFRTILDTCCQENFVLGANLNTAVRDLTPLQDQIRNSMLELGLLSGTDNIFLKVWRELDEMKK